MSDVFISYSRKDSIFARQLHDALVANDRDIWIDWEDIPLSADWWAEIRSGIEGSNIFVFIISPDSVVSEVCYKEINCAVELNKRMIPLLHRDVEANTVPQEVASLNWIFFRDDDNFDNALTNLIDTMDTDLEWVKAHTRLTERAVEWDRQERNDSFLLRGDDLADAEQRLIQTGKDPLFTDLQGQYILSSRQNAVKRQRIMIGAIAFGLVVAIILGAIAFMNFLRADREFQRANLAEKTAVAGAATAWEAVGIAQVEQQNARQAEKTAQAGEQIAWRAVETADANAIRAATAEANAYILRDIATSRELAADAINNLAIDPELSLLLALHGLSIAHTDQVETALRRALEVSQVGSSSTLSTLGVEELRVLAESYVTRSLTTAECQKYLHMPSCL